MTKPSTLFFLDLIQDFDLAWPIIQRAIQAGKAQVSVCLTKRFYRRSGAALDTFRRHSVAFYVAADWKLRVGLEPDLKNVTALVTFSESSAKPHAKAYRLALRANRLDIKTYTLQHGFENIGLTYFDRQYRPSSVKFASSKIFIWNDLSSLHPQASAEVRARCLPVGYPKELVEAMKCGKMGGRSFLITVCENLHWQRYTNDYRRRFLIELATVAATYADTTFLLRPHPDEQWSVRHWNKANTPKNLLIASPGYPAWQKYNLASFLNVSDGVITTPSTVALDAAKMGLPVGIVSDRDKLPAYGPLFLIHKDVDWLTFINFVRQDEDRQKLIRRSGLFVERALLPGDAIGRILEYLHCDDPCRGVS